MTSTSNRGQAAPALERRAPQWRSRSIALDAEVRLAVFEAGSDDREAPTAVLVHGLGHWTQACWDAAAAALAATHRVIAFDLPGFGASSKPDRAYAPALFCSALERVVAEFAPEHYTLVGHSLGGLTAAAFAAQRPQGLASLALIAPIGFRRTSRQLLRILAARPFGAIFPNFVPPPALVRRTLELSVYDTSKLTAEDYDAALRATRDPAANRAFARVYRDALRTYFDLPATHRALARWQGPTLLAWGREDRYVPIAALETARRVYPNARVEVFERCGHLPSFEYPERLAAILGSLPA